MPPIVPDLVPRWMVHMGHADQSTLYPLYISTGDDLALKFCSADLRIEACKGEYASPAPSSLEPFF